MKPAENQLREVPKMGNSFDTLLFKRKVADLLRQNKPQEVNYYASELSSSFPKERSFIFLEVSRMMKQRMCLLGIPDLKFDDYRTEEQRQIFYEGLSNEPPFGEKINLLNSLLK